MSKFGTLVLVRGATPILPHFNKAMQIGRTVVNFSIKSFEKKTSGQEEKPAAVIQNEHIQDKLDDLKLAGEKKGINFVSTEMKPIEVLPEKESPEQVEEERGEEQI